jgi:hypothetical protein
VLLQIDVIIDIHTRPFPFCEQVGLCWQWPQGGQIDTAIEFLARARQFAEGPLVQLSGQLTDGFIEFRQAEELPFAQGRQHPALDDLYSGFDLGLINYQQLQAMQADHLVGSASLILSIPYLGGSTTSVLDIATGEKTGSSTMTRTVA